MNDKKIYDELINILIKKANGFYFTEEQEDYEKTQNSKFSNEKYINNISFFDKNDTANTKINDDNDTIKSTNGRIENENKGLVLVKKKITTHYIPPDMLAIKILFETLKEKVNSDDLEKMSDDELLKIKDKLIGEILNEDNSNNWKHKMWFSFML